MKKWIVQTYNFNADEGAASFHIDDRVDAILKVAPGSVFFSGPLGTPHGGVPHTVVHSVSPAGIRYEIRYWVKRNPTAWRKTVKTLTSAVLFPLYILEKILVPLEARWSWALTTTRLSRRAILQGGADAVYSTGGPYCAHLSGWATARLTGIPWIAELQDPVGIRELAKGKWDLFWNLAVEKFILRHADLTVWLTDGARDRAIALGGDPERQITLRPWTRWEATEPGESFEKFAFTHLGTLGGSRNLDPILAALDILARQYPESLDRITFVLGGNIPAEIREKALASPHARVFDFIGKVPRARAHDIMQRSDVLLVIQNTTEVSRLTIPSKVYEYLNSSRRILALTHHNTEIAPLLRDGDRAAEASDGRAVADAILALSSAGRRPATPANRGPEAPVEELAKRIRNLNTTR